MMSASFVDGTKSMQQAQKSYLTFVDTIVQSLKSEKLEIRLVCISKITWKSFVAEALQPIECYSVKQHPYSGERTKQDIFIPSYICFPSHSASHWNHAGYSILHCPRFMHGWQS